MNHFWALFAATALLATLPAGVSAQQLAHTTKDVNLRAGPARDYPVVTVLPGGVQVVVEGCVPDYRWCDVVAGPLRGWVYAKNIVYPYEGNSVPVLDYGAVIGIGIAAFVVGDYWDRHYRGRPWYGQRQHWIGHPPAGFRPGWNRPPPPSGHRPGFGEPRPGPGPGNGFYPGQHGRPPGAGTPAQQGIPGGNRPPHNDMQGLGRPHDRFRGANQPQQAGPRNSPGGPGQGDRSQGGHRGR
jgi:uncharacterized protein YraI